MRQRGAHVGRYAIVKLFDRPGPAQASIQLPRLKEGRGELASVLKETHDSLRISDEFHRIRTGLQATFEEIPLEKAAGGYAQMTSAKGKLGIALTI